MIYFKLIIAEISRSYSQFWALLALIGPLPEQVVEGLLASLAAGGNPFNKYNRNMTILY